MIRPRCLLTLFVLIAIAVPGIYSQAVGFPAIKGYRLVKDYPVYTPDDLWNYINGAADAYLALGFIDLNIAEYVKGKQTIKAEVYRFGSDIESFGIYSLERSPEYHFIQTGVQGYAEEGVLNFYKGEYYIKIMTHSKAAKADETMRVVADKIAESIKGRNEFPAIFKLFPAEGLLKNQETYILEDVLGHDFLNDAVRATYEVDSDRFEIYLFNDPSEEEASAMTEKISGSPSESGNSETEKYVVRDGFNGLLFIARKGARLVIISGLAEDKTQLAERYIDLIVGKL